MIRERGVAQGHAEGTRGNQLTYIGRVTPDLLESVMHRRVCKGARQVAARKQLLQCSGHLCMLRRLQAERAGTGPHGGKRVKSRHGGGG